MTKFRYIAKDMRGKTYKGIREAVTEDVLVRQLREQGLFLVDAKAVDQSEKYKKLKAKQLALFCLELSTLLASGVSLVHALDVITGQEGIDAKERKIYLSVSADLKRGISLADAMKKRQCFPTLMIGMIRSGEENGNLAQVTERLAIQYEKENKLVRQIRSAMIYPMILLILCILVSVIVITFILPQFQMLFNQMDHLPVPTKVLISVSDFLIHRWYIAGLFFIFVFAIIRILSENPAVCYWTARKKLGLPGVGRIFKVLYTARFSRTLNSLYSGGMSLAKAVEIAGDTIGNSYIEAQMDQVVEKMRSGIPLSRALEETEGLTKKLSSIVFIGEESGHLDLMLESVAATMEDEAEQAARQLVTLLEPAMIILMAILVGFIMIAVMLPIYQSYAVIENL